MVNNKSGIPTLFFKKLDNLLVIFQLRLTPSPRVTRILVPEKHWYAKTVLVETPFMYIVYIH